VRWRTSSCPTSPSSGTGGPDPACLSLQEQAALIPGRRRDGNPVLEWCLGNSIGEPDRRGNLYPTKQRPEQKIDAAVALTMAVGRAMAADDGQADLLEFLRNPVFG
jgi:hypothetical protein